MNLIAIRAQSLGKKYRVGRRESYHAIRDVVTSLVSDFVRKPGKINDLYAAQQKKEIWALKNVSLEVKKGEALGIIGPNGAGKSTLLKILSRITAPTEGRAEISGRIGSLLEVGTGFHPELTGRENIYLNGSILGMRKNEIAKKFDQIVEFAGISQFIDTPVKHFSSGMYVRLAFSVAAHLETEILLVDEVLAVGDAAFQLKCLTKMSEIAQSERTILFISHNMEAIRKLCDRSLLLDQGKVVKLGITQDVINSYLSSIREQAGLTSGQVSLKEHPGRTKQHGGSVQLASIQTFQNGEPKWKVTCGGDFEVVLGYEVTGSAAHKATFSVVFSNVYNQRITTCRSSDTSSEDLKAQGRGRAICKIRHFPLRPGLYKISVGCDTEAGHSDGLYDVATLEVIGTDYYPSGQLPPAGFGDVLIDHAWEFTKL